MTKAFYVTTPIYYVNDAPHIGHAYTTVAGDVLTRWRRQRQEDVFYLTGTDEHGTKVERTARDNGVEPQEWASKLVEESWKPVLDTIDAANDDFIRTTSDRHRIGVQKFWETLKENGYVYEADFEGPYCVGCEEFKRAGDLVDGKCPIHDRPVEMLHETNYFFKLAAFQDRLLEHYERHPAAVEPKSAYNEVVSFIRGGLDDISMSRSSVSWGVPLPWDEEQVVYVWFDALLNYITAIGYGQDQEKFDSIWPANVHLVGKDILRFHAVYWPAMLMAADLPLPEKVFAHGWLLVGGEKMSKSKLTGISPDQIIDDFGSDAFRYYFLRAIQFGQDGSFSWEDMAARYTSELANGLGNLASRATAMIGKYREGVLPEPGDYANADLALQELLVAAAERADAAMLQLDFSTGILAIKEFVDAVNVYVTEQEPWVLAKDEESAQRLDTVLYTICESLRAIAVLYHPVMPKSSVKIWESLGAAGELAEQAVTDVATWGQLAPGSTVTKGAALFPRLETT
ncbi:MAG: methionine--tRNA ligase [Candidatus Nanopelagicales bacterium]|jgi:methionyl-tRNA synthetase|nr:methionine--tRNA ligase [Candidatus Nanopelagicales bacterium]MCU0299310.1 methionine--tRNA ligase [Candidatus Nanopelagicales bacterium]